MATKKRAHREKYLRKWLLGIRKTTWEDVFIIFLEIFRLFFPPFPHFCIISAGFTTVTLSGDARALGHTVVTEPEQCG